MTTVGIAMIVTTVPRMADTEILTAGRADTLTGPDTTTLSDTPVTLTAPTIVTTPPVASVTTCVPRIVLITCETLVPTIIV